MSTRILLADDQELFLDGLRDLQDRCFASYGAHFLIVKQAQRLDLVSVDLLREHRDGDL